MSDQLATLDSLTPDNVLYQIQQVQLLMSKAMKENEHYGVIPGTQGKPTLLKSGAEKLCLMFRLAPSYEVNERDLPGGHLEVKVKCTLTQIHTGRIFGQGIASASSLESKYRYRTDIVRDDQGQPVPVPKAYWGSRDPQILGGTEFRPAKRDGQWVIMQRGENTDPADTWNTVRKIAAKRAYVSATLSATAASDIFTQDLEDMAPAEELRQERNVTPPQQRPSPPPPAQAQHPANGGEQKQANPPARQDGTSQLTGLLRSIDSKKYDDGTTRWFGHINAWSIWTDTAEVATQWSAAVGTVIHVLAIPSRRTANLYKLVSWRWDEAAKDPRDEPGEIVG